MTRKITLIALVVCSFALTAVVAQATTISLPITNGDFEATPTGAIGLYPFSPSPYSNYSGTIPSWSQPAQDTAGVYTGSSVNSQTVGSSSPGPYFKDTWNPDTHGLSGSRYAYIVNSLPQWAIWQQLTTDGTTPFTFATVGDVLTVNFWQNSTKASSLAVQLFRDSAPPEGTRIDGAANFALTTPWTWQSDTFTYTATSADLAKPLWFRLGWGSGLAQPLVDDVTASYTPIPEPSTLVLLAAGLVGLLCYAWRKRR